MKNSAQILVFLILLLVGCKNTESEKEISDVEFEQKVFNKVFINIVDSTYLDKRIYASPPTKEEAKDPNWIAEMEAIEKDTFNIVIAVDKRFKDAEQLKSAKFIFKDFKELPEIEDYKNWSEKYKKFAAVMSFAYITFDKAKENGKIEVSCRCGWKAGIGYIVYLKKINGKWTVVKKEETWIS
jgi:hypothetical protein